MVSVLAAVFFRGQGGRNTRPPPWPGMAAGGCRGALCSGGPKVRFMAGMGSWGGGGAPRAHFLRGEAPPWPAGVGHGGLPPPMAFLAGARGIWGFGGTGGVRRAGAGPQAWGPAAGRRRAAGAAVPCPCVGGKSRGGRRLP